MVPRGLLVALAAALIAIRHHRGPRPLPPGAVCGRDGLWECAERHELLLLGLCSAACDRCADSAPAAFARAVNVSERVAGAWVWHEEDPALFDALAVDAWPTFLLFRDGEVVAEAPGDWTRLERFVRRALRPRLPTLASQAAMDAFLRETVEELDQVAVLVSSSANAKAVETLAMDELDSRHAFALVAPPLQLDRPLVVTECLRHDAGEEQLCRLGAAPAKEGNPLFTAPLEEWPARRLSQWLADHELPVVGEMTPRNADAWYGAGLPILFVYGQSPAAVAGVARRWRHGPHASTVAPQLLFAVVESEAENPDPARGDVTIADLEAEESFSTRFSSEDGLDAFVADYFAGRLLPDPLPVEEPPWVDSEAVGVAVLLAAAGFVRRGGAPGLLAGVAAGIAATRLPLHGWWLRRLLELEAAVGLVSSLGYGALVALGWAGMHAGSSGCVC